MRGLLTNKELAPLVGSDRTLREWQARAVIPKPQAIDGFGPRRFRLYPEFALVQVVAKRHPVLPALHDSLMTATEQLFGTDAFRSCVEILKQHINETTDSGIRSVTNVLNEYAADAVEALQDTVDSIESALDERFDMNLTSSVGTVLRLSQEQVVVSVDDLEQRFDGRHAPLLSLREGDAVRCEVISMSGITEGFVIPTVAGSDRLEWKKQALRELVDAVSATEGQGELPSMEYTFLFSFDAVRESWLPRATEQLQATRTKSDWEEILNESSAKYIAEHPSLQALPIDDERHFERVIIGGDRWANWQAPDLFS
jgi:hypothetical protein